MAEEFLIGQLPRDHVQSLGSLTKIKQANPNKWQQHIDAPAC